ISNGIVALSGALLAQYKGSANITDGSGAIVTGLAAIFIGLSVSMKIKPNFVVSLIGVVFGGVVYYTIYTVVIVLGVNTDYLKMLSATIVVAFLAVPYLKNTYFKSAKAVPPIVETQAGGDDDA
ncbi:MAG: ABC transporter permease, partial [Oscillospiraceae bacterium]|nr:ABC transporter permease [Oscillospiraceae bacterium]